MQPSPIAETDGPPLPRVRCSSVGMLPLPVRIGGIVQATTPTKFTGRKPMASQARVALITGCGKPVGIGNSTARALAAAGVTVVVSDVSPTGVANEHNVQGDIDSHWGGVDSLVEELVRNGRTASSTLGDVSVAADAGRMVGEV